MLIVDPDLIENFGKISIDDYEDGWDASDDAFYYYREGMKYSDAKDKEKRLDCFRKSELLHRHAVNLGEWESYIGLGYIYSYNRCEGEYYSDPAVPQENLSEDELAFKAFEEGSRHDDSECFYKLGDMYKKGRGCEASPAEAFKCYEKAFELSKEDEPYRWGSVALRLADCYESGFGCEQNLKTALKWYNQAVMGLEIAVNEGDSYYTKVYHNALAAQKRIQQELSGNY